MNQPVSIFALGEVLWDIFDDGLRFGGAPANFACACAELGVGIAKVMLVSAVGNDPLGDDARTLLNDHLVDTRYLNESQFPTGQVFVKLDTEGRASYRFLEKTAWDHLATSPDLLKGVQHADVVCFGTLGQRSAISSETIRTLVQAAPPKALRILDLNLRPPYWNEETIRVSLTLADILKLNDEELPILAELLRITGSEEGIIQSLIRKYDFKMVALTRGAKGSLILTSTKERSKLASKPVQIVDTVGAGDAFTAGLVLGLVTGATLEETHEFASNAAAFVCTQAGGTPHFPKGLRIRTPFL